MHLAGPARVHVCLTSSPAQLGTRRQIWAGKASGHTGSSVQAHMCLRGTCVPSSRVATLGATAQSPAWWHLFRICAAAYEGIPKTRVHGCDLSCRASVPSRHSCCPCNQIHVSWGLFADSMCQLCRASSRRKRAPARHGWHERGEIKSRHRLYEPHDTEHDPDNTEKRQATKAHPTRATLNMLGHGGLATAEDLLQLRGFNEAPGGESLREHV
jgi:hypothetical protein